MKIGKKGFNKLMLSALCLVAFGYGPCGYAGGGQSKPAVEQPTDANVVANQDEKNGDKDDGKERDEVGTPEVPTTPAYPFEVSKDGKNVTVTIGESTPERIITTRISVSDATKIVKQLEETSRQHIIFNNVVFESGAFTIIGGALHNVAELTINGHDNNDNSLGIREIIKTLLERTNIRLGLTFTGATNEAKTAIANLSQKNQLIQGVVTEINGATPNNQNNQITPEDFNRLFTAPVQLLTSEQATQLNQLSGFSVETLSQQQKDQLAQLTALRDQTNQRNQLIAAFTTEQTTRINQIIDLHNAINIFLYQQPNAERNIHGIWLNPLTVRTPSTMERALATASSVVSSVNNALWTIGTLNGRLAKATAASASSSTTTTTSTSTSSSSSSSSTNDGTSATVTAGPAAIASSTVSTTTTSTSASSSSSPSSTNDGTSATVAAEPAAVIASSTVSATTPGVLSRGSSNMANIIKSSFGMIGTPFGYVVRGVVRGAVVVRNAAVTVATTTGSAVATAVRLVGGVPGRVGHRVWEIFRRTPAQAQGAVVPVALQAAPVQQVDVQPQAETLVSSVPVQQQAASTTPIIIDNYSPENNANTNTNNEIPVAQSLENSINLNAIPVAQQLENITNLNVIPAARQLDNPLVQSETSSKKGWGFSLFSKSNFDKKTQ